MDPVERQMFGLGVEAWSPAGGVPASEFLEVLESSGLEQGTGARVQWCLSLRFPSGDGWSMLVGPPFWADECDDPDVLLYLDQDVRSLRVVAPTGVVGVDVWDGPATWC